MALVAGTLVAQRYRLSAPLGGGAQGTVWEAVDTRRGGTLCAIKFARTVIPLHTEFESLLSLVHPGLPRALDYGTHEGGTFLVLERIAGRPLDARMDRTTVVRALADVADALATLHDTGLVHGDVKPANVLVGADRTVLVDLGLATPVGTGAPSGTLAFLAPEALAGERGPAMDLYALGVTAALALTGEHPLVSDATDRHALLGAIARRERPRDSVVAALPASVRGAVASLLQPEPDARPASARALLARLARDASGELTPAQRERALQTRSERTLRIARIADDDAVEATVDALEAALRGEALGAVISGPAGAGRARVVDDAIRAVLIAHAARGTPPEIVETVPAEPARPTIVRLVDADPEVVLRAVSVLRRVLRFADSPAPVILVATAAEPLRGAGVRDVTVPALGRAALARILEALAGRAPEEATVDAWIDATGGLAGRVVHLAHALDPEGIASATHDDLARVQLIAPAQRLEAGLDRDARDAAWLIAAAGEPVRVDDLSRWLGAQPAMLALAELARRNVVLVRDDVVRLASAVDLGALDDAERARIGTTLERLVATHDPSRATVRARAALLRGDLDAARVHAGAAAHHAQSPLLARIHWLEVVASLDRDSAPRALALASAWITAGEPRRALGVLAPLAESVEVMVLRAEALRRAGDTVATRALAERLTTEEA
ncbi:MAG: serine/threonine-protein kinase, partial [Deltaproteobacteria bacterium]